MLLWHLNDGKGWNVFRLLIALLTFHSLFISSEKERENTPSMVFMLQSTPSPNLSWHRSVGRHAHTCPVCSGGPRIQTWDLSYVGSVAPQPCPCSVICPRRFFFSYTVCWSDVFLGRTKTEGLRRNESCYMVSRILEWCGWACMISNILLIINNNFIHNLYRHAIGLSEKSQCIFLWFSVQNCMMTFPTTQYFSEVFDRI